MMTDSPPRAWVEISLQNLTHNIQVARAHFTTSHPSRSPAIMAVVKAGAYGHGLTRISQLFEKEGVDFLGVANVGEARTLEQNGVKSRKYLLGVTFEEERLEIVQNRWTPCISSMAEAISFSKLNLELGFNQPLPVHLAVDTGMGRGGYLPDALYTDFSKLQNLEGIQLEGIATHLPSADEDRNFTIDQHSRFDEIIAKLGGPKLFKYIHIGNTAGLLDYQSKYANLCRPGLMLYGISPLTDFQKTLKPTLTFKSRITLIRELPTGHGVSYGRSYITKKPTLVATVGAGYGDGYPRNSQGQGFVFLNDKKCPIIGRVTMDQMMIDITEAPMTQVGDIAELYGEQLNIKHIAENAETIPWEVLTRITSRVQRVYH